MGTKNTLPAHVGVGLIIAVVAMGLLAPVVTTYVERERSDTLDIKRSLVFTRTNRLIVEHYILFPVEPARWQRLTNKYKEHISSTAITLE